MRSLRWGLPFAAALGTVLYCCIIPGGDRAATKSDPAVEATAARAVLTPPPSALEPFVEKAIGWLAEAQQQNGGFGGGSHSAQEVRDAHAVPTDPATTAVAAMALLRAGNGLDHGTHHATLRRATEWMLTTIEAAKADGPQITELTGTQPQAKMGQNVDTALAAQFLSRLLRDLPKDAELRPRAERALDKCLRKIQGSQSGDGSWAAGGWAPVLQTAQMTTALEQGELAGRTIDKDSLSKARDYQKQLLVNSAGTPAADPAGTRVGGAGAATEMFLATSSLRADAAAGVQLYASAANARAIAAEARAAGELVEEGKKAGKLAQDAKVDAATLEQLGLSKEQARDLDLSSQMNVAAKVRAFDERVLDGFGNNGGEEFLSYQMKSESLAIDGGEEWGRWMGQMRERLAKVQNTDGSWSGHHCITSPVFCTATAISCLTADRDVEWLRQASKPARR